MRVRGTRDSIDRIRANWVWAGDCDVGLPLGVNDMIKRIMVSLSRLGKVPGSIFE
jgi:hypothetical protein